MEKILEILGELCPGVDFERETDFIDNGLIDSFDMISLVTELSDAFDIEIGVLDITPENFNSLDAISALVERLQ